MPQINCYLPIKLCITGRLSDAQLEQLSETVVRALSARISFAEHELAARRGERSREGGVEIVREGYEPDRDDGTGSYGVPSYQGGGQPVRMSLRRNAGRRPWFIRKAINFHSRIGNFLDFAEDLNGGQSELSGKLLYMDIYEQLRWVSLWLVQVNQQYTLRELETILSGRAMQLSHVRANQVLAYGMGTTEGLRRRLMRIDEDRIVSREIPNIGNHNRRLATEIDGDVNILPGGWVLFAGMVLPKVELGDLIWLGSVVSVSLPLHALDFIVPSTSFERLFGISWNSHVNQFGDQLAPLRMLPFTTLRRVHFDTLRSLVEPIVANSVERDFAYFGGLSLLNQSRINWLPSAARPMARQLTDEITLPLEESRRAGWWEAGWHGAFIYAVVNETGEQPVQPEAERAGQQEPSETPERLISRFTSHWNLDEDGLGTHLVGLIRRSPALSYYVQRVLDELDSSDRDDVSLAFAETATDADLDILAHSPNGRLLLGRLYDELTSGELGGSEREQSDRLLAARVRSRSIEVVTRRLETARGWIFPYRQGGPTVIDDSPIEAELLADGRIRVRLMVRVAGTDEFRNEVRTLPEAVFTSGLVLEPDEWVRVKLYDEGGIIVQQPALYLLQIANQGITKTLHTVGNVILAVGSFGVGGAAVGASWGVRTLVFLDRAAAALSVISIVVNDHRGWIIETFGDDGRTFLRTVEIANAVAGVYGIARLAISAPRLIVNVRNAWRSWRATPAFGNLRGADLSRAEELSQGVEQFINNADEAAAAAQREAAAVPRETSSPGESSGSGAGAGTAQRPRAPGGPGATGGTPPVILYRGTTYRFIRGRSTDIHDLGEGMYMTHDPDLAILYAQERRVDVQVTDPGAPGIVLRVEAEQGELGRVLDFYNDPALRADWEAFVSRQPLGDVVLQGGPAQIYNGHFQNWLRARGRSLNDFDVIIGPEYIRGGPQVCVRNETIADQLLIRAEEWARAHEPVAPAYPDIPAPRVPSE
jgi:hypothetical protein